jgi:hypothetical protein
MSRQPLTLKDLPAFCLTCRERAVAAAAVDDPRSRDVVLTISCHGALERVTVPEVDLFDRVRIDAFKPPSVKAVA